MTKIRKLKRKKKFRANVNRKRLRNKLNKLPTIECAPIKNAWDKKYSVVKNLESMGLAYNPNKSIKISKHENNIFDRIENNEIICNEKNVGKNNCQKSHVVESLEADAKAPRQKLFRLPNNEVQFVVYMLDNYGDDYKAMVRDRKNINQLTWRQIRSKINVFKNIPEQYAEYLVKKGEIILDNPEPLKKIKPVTNEKPLDQNKNVNKKKTKRNKTNLIKCVWEEELIDEDNKIYSDVHDELKENTSEKKLKLFPDECDEIISDSENLNNIKIKTKTIKNKGDSSKLKKKIKII